MNMIYRVILRVGYYEAYFDFVEAVEAVSFAQNALVHMVPSEDTKKKYYVTMQIVNPELEESEDDD